MLLLVVALMMVALMLVALMLVAMLLRMMMQFLATACLAEHAVARTSGDRVPSGARGRQKFWRPSARPGMCGPELRRASRRDTKTTHRAPVSRFVPRKASAFTFTLSAGASARRPCSFSLGD